MILTEKHVDGDFNQILKISDESFAGQERPPRGILRSHFEADDVFIRTMSNQIVAFAFVTERFGAPYIWSIAVTPQYRGAGLGSVLLQEIAQRYQGEGRGSICLTCKVDNPAQKLYFDMGYRVERVAQKYYGPEGDGLFFRKIL